MISVIITADAGKIDLKEHAFDSIRNQSYTNIEIIIASKENGIRAESIPESIKFIHVPKDDDCLLTAFEQSIGEYIVFIDQTDALTLNWIYSAVRGAEYHDADLLMTPIAVRKENIIKYYNNDPLFTFNYDLENASVFEEYIKNGINFKSFLCTGNKLIRRDLFEKCVNEMRDFFPGKPAVFFGRGEFIAGRLFFHSKKCVNIRNHFLIFNERNQKIESYFKNTSLNLICEIYGQVIDSVKAISQDYIQYFGNFKKISLRRLIREFSDIFALPLDFSQKFVADYFKLKKHALNPDKGDNYFDLLTTELYPRYEDYEKIVSFISNSETEYVMFDVFDTLIMRPFWSPSDLFNLVEVEFSRALGTDVIDFPAMRGAALSNRVNYFKQKYGKDYAVTYDDTYDYISECYGISKGAVDAARNKEYYVEMKYSYAREAVKQLFELAQYHNKKIILISDMYLSSKFIRQVLEKCGYKGFEIYVSCEGNGAKSNGKIYEYLKSVYSIAAPEKSCMIGDSMQSDVVKAQEAGFTAFNVPQTAALLKESEAYKFTYLSHENTVTHKLPTNLGLASLLRIIANSIYDFPFIPENKNIKINDLRMFSYFNLGLFSFSFVKWLIDNIKGKPIKNIHFCARDGLLFKNIYDKLRDRFEDLPGSNYLTISRALLYPIQCGINLENIQVSTSSMTPRYFINNFKSLILPDKLKTVAQDVVKAGYGYDEDMTVNKDRFIKFVNFVKTEFLSLELYGEYHSIIKKYYEQQINPGDVIVDSGYSGRIEAALTRLLGYPLDSFYFTKALPYAQKRADYLGFKSQGFLNFYTKHARAVKYEYWVTKAIYKPSVKEIDIQKQDFKPHSSEDLSVESYVRKLMHMGAEMFVDEIIEIADDLLDTFMFDYSYIEGSIPMETFLENGMSDAESIKIIAR